MTEPDESTSSADSEQDDGSVPGQSAGADAAGEGDSEGGTLEDTP